MLEGVENSRDCRIFESIFFISFLKIRHVIHHVSMNVWWTVTTHSSTFLFSFEKPESYSIFGLELHFFFTFSCSETNFIPSFYSFFAWLAFLWQYKFITTIIKCSGNLFFRTQNSCDNSRLSFFIIMRCSVIFHNFWDASFKRKNMLHPLMTTENMKNCFFLLLHVMGQDNRLFYYLLFYYTKKEGGKLSKLIFLRSKVKKILKNWIKKFKTSGNIACSFYNSLEFHWNVRSDALRRRRLFVYICKY